jgi:alkylated DNA repair protein alkB family protein 6
MDIYANGNSSKNNEQMDLEEDKNLNLEQSTLEEKREHVFSLILQPRSLLIVKDELYINCLHGIAFNKEDIITDKVANLELACHKVGDIIQRERRISLTIRVVKKVLKNVIKI